MQTQARARVVIPAAPEAVYGHLAAMELYPAWMHGLRQVRRVGRRRRVWVLDGPQGPQEWQVEVTVDHPPSRFGFCMEAPGFIGSTLVRIYGSGSMAGVAVTQDLEVSSALAPRFADWWGDPDARLRRDLWRFTGALRHWTQGSVDLTKSLSGPSSTSLFSS